MPEAQQPVARHLVEDLLIKDGVRLPFAERALLAERGVTRDLLDGLTDASLLRVERDEQGRMLYEVGHDTLVGPIGEAAKARREGEREVALLQEAERQIQERRKITRARRNTLIIGTGAVLLLLFAFYQTWVASQARSDAKASELKSLEKTVEAENLDSIARFNAAKAESALDTAEVKTLEAQRNFDEAKRQTGIASAETQRAAAALRQVTVERTKAESAAVVIVDNLLKNADDAVRILDYDEALINLADAEDLVKERPGGSPLYAWQSEVAYALMEPAYVLSQIKEHLAARLNLQRVAALLHQPAPELTKIIGNDRLADRMLLEAVMKKIAPTRLTALEHRYQFDPIIVPAGAFLMGSDTTCKYCDENESPSHEVHLKQFQLARTETTIWKYNLYCLNVGRHIENYQVKSWELRGDDPVVNISWYDAVLYANWLSDKQGFNPAYHIDSLSGNWVVTPTGDAGYRLPTEAEWEYAARNAGRDNYRYAGSDTLENVGWYDGNSERTQQTAQLKANGLGLYDMSGNVWEWCWDWYDDYPPGPMSDWNGPNKGGYRVLRGGGWRSVPQRCRVAGRYRYSPAGRDDGIGFRLARSF